MEAIKALIEMSHRYGSDHEFVLAGGGNTSYKTEDMLYVKGSGTALATISESGFVKMDRKKLSAMLEKKYSENEAEREAEVLADMMAAKCAGEEAKRPSVETLLHDLLPYKFVLHVHPALVNGITCARGGEAAGRRLFPDAVWVGSTKPGYILAALCKEKTDAYKAEKGSAPKLIFLQNHGIFFAADTVDEIDRAAAETMAKIKENIKRFPDRSEAEYDRAAALRLAPEIRMLYGEGGNAVVTFTVNKDILSFAASREAFAPIAGGFSPDHIVYCKAEPLLVEAGENLPAKAEAAFAAYKAQYGYAPKIIFVSGVGMFSCGKTKKEADTAAAVFADAMSIAVYSESFGGALPLDEELTRFIKKTGR